MAICGLRGSSNDFALEKVLVWKRLIWGHNTKLTINIFYIQGKVYELHNLINSYTPEKAASLNPLRQEV